MESPRTDLEERLAGMLPAEFDEIVFRTKVPPDVLSSEKAPQGQRAIEVVRYFTQPGQDVRVLEAALGMRTGHAPSPPPHYIERPDLIAKLERAMGIGAERASDAAPAGGSAVLVGLQGAGGVGKTTLAEVFVARHGDRFARVLWVDVRTQGGSTEAVAEAVLTALGARSRPVASVEDALARLGPLLDDFARGPKPLLLVLDNADRADDQFRRLTDGLLGPGLRMLVTTRSRTLADALQGDAIDVGVFGEAEAIACLRAWMTDGGKLATPRAGDEAGLRAAVRRLGALPLAVKLAGAYLCKKPRTTLADYVRQAPLPDFRGEGVDLSLGRTLAILTVAERVTLDACAACAATGFTVPSVARAAPGEAPDDQIELRAHLARLHEWSLLDTVATPISDGGAPGYRLHPLVRERLRQPPGFAAVAERHADRLLALLGPKSRELDPVEAVKDELMAAVDSARERRDDARLIAMSTPALA